MKQFLFAVAAVVLLAGSAAGQEPLSWSFDRRLTDLEKRVAAVEKALGVAQAPAAPPTATIPRPAVLSTPPPSVVLVDRKLPSVPLGNGVFQAGNGGSGVVVWSDGKTSLVATAKHVTPDDGLGVTVTHNGRQYPAKVRLVGNYQDLAILSVDAALPAAEVLDRGPGEGVVLTHFGRTTGRSQGKAVGWVNVGGAECVQTDYSSDSGDSGAGVFDPAGRVAGVHTGRQGDGVITGRAIAPSVVKEYVGWVLAGHSRIPGSAVPTVSTAGATGACVGGVCYPAAPAAAGGTCVGGTCYPVAPAAGFGNPVQYVPFGSPLGGSYCPTGRCPNVR